MVEQGFYDRLAVVEGAFERDGVDVRGVDARHLAALHLRHAPMRIEDEDVDLREALEGLDGGAAGVPRRRPDDGGAPAPALQDMVHELREELHRDVLEGERRPMKQLED